MERLTTCLLVCASLTSAALAQDTAEAAQARWLEDEKGRPAQTNRLPLPPGAKVGTWWEYRVRDGEGRERFAITKEVDGKLVVETRITQEVLVRVKGKLKEVEVALVEALLVDPSVDLETQGTEVGQPYPHNVVQAWIGAEGGGPHPRKVSEPETAKEASEVGDGFTSEEVTVRFAKRSWEAVHRRGTKRPGFESILAKGTLFILKASVNGYVMYDLKKMGRNARSKLKWPREEAGKKR